MAGTDVTIREEPAEARGRNGWFTPAIITVRPDSTAGVRISVASSRPFGDMPPIFLRLSDADARALGAAITTAAGG